MDGPHELPNPALKGLGSRPAAKEGKEIEGGVEEGNMGRKVQTQVAKDKMRKRMFEVREDRVKCKAWKAQKATFEKNLPTVLWEGSLWKGQPCNCIAQLRGIGLARTARATEEEVPAAVSDKIAEPTKGTKFLYGFPIVCME